MFDVLWLGDAQAGYFGRRPLDRRALLMRWTAVPQDHVISIRRQLLEDGYLAAACDWARQALEQGNAWTSHEHRCRVVHDKGTVTTAES